jgi:hypothetical protein
MRGAVSSLSAARNSRRRGGLLNNRSARGGGSLSASRCIAPHFPWLNQTPSSDMSKEYDDWSGLLAMDAAIR